MNKKKFPKDENSNLYIIEQRMSKTQNVTLMYSNEKGTGFTKLSYNFHTMLEEYSDGTSENFLVSEVRLADLETVDLVDGVSSIRLTIGWKNP